MTAVRTRLQCAALAVAGVALLAAAVIAQTTSAPTLAKAAELLQQNRPSEAESLLRRLVQAGPGDAAAWNLLGAALDTQHKCQPAEEAFQKAARLAPGAAAVWNNLGNHYAACGNPSAARDSFRRVLTLEPAHANANLQLARIAVENKEGAEALTRLQKLGSGVAAEPALALLRARALLLAGRKAESVAALDQLEKRVDGPAAWHALGLAFAECGEFDRAVALFSRALESDPSNAEIQHHLGMAALRAGQPGPFVANPAKAGVLIASGRAQMEAGKKDEALALLERARAANPSAEERLDLVMALSQLSGPAAALKELEKTPPGDRNGDFYLVKAQLLDWMGNSKEAAENLNLCLAASPKRPDLLRSAALFLVKESQYRVAADLLEHATLVNPEDRDLLLLKGVVLAILGRMEESRGLLEQVTKRWPEWSRPYLLRGILEQSLSRSDESLKSIQKAMELGERGPEAYFYLGLALLRAAPESTGRALEAAQRAAEMRPDDPWARLLAGRILKQSGDSERAVGYLREAVKLRPGLALAHYWLGSAYVALGKTSEGQQEMAEVDRLRERDPAAVDAEDWGLQGKLFLLIQ